ncbi:MAG: hypothetical protein JW388_0962 [Nitrospira sp.]|nr:hypothetical protein [Nitrospira sp.]
MAGIGYIDFKNPAMTGAITDTTSRMLLASGQSIMQGIDEMSIKAEAAILGPQIGKNYAEGYRRLSRGDMGGWDDVAKARSMSVTNPLLLKSAGEADDIAKAITAAHFQEKMALELNAVRERMNTQDNLTNLSGVDATNANRQGTSRASSRPFYSVDEDGNPVVSFTDPATGEDMTPAQTGGASTRRIVPADRSHIDGSLPKGTSSANMAVVSDEPPLPEKLSDNGLPPMTDEQPGSPRQVQEQMLPAAVQKSALVKTNKAGVPLTNRQIDIQEYAKQKVTAEVQEYGKSLEADGDLRPQEIAEMVSAYARAKYNSIVSDKVVQITEPDAPLGVVMEKNDEQAKVIWEAHPSGLSSKKELTDEQKEFAKRYDKNTDLLAKATSYLNTSDGIDWYADQIAKGNRVTFSHGKDPKAASLTVETMKSSSGETFSIPTTATAKDGTPYDTTKEATFTEKRGDTFKDNIADMNTAIANLKKDGIDVKVDYRKLGKGGTEKKAEAEKPTIAKKKLSDRADPVAAQEAVVKQEASKKVEIENRKTALSGLVNDIAPLIEKNEEGKTVFDLRRDWLSKNSENKMPSIDPESRTRRFSIPSDIHGNVKNLSVSDYGQWQDHITRQRSEIERDKRMLDKREQQIKDTLSQLGSKNVERDYNRIVAAVISGQGYSILEKDGGIEIGVVPSGK